MSFVLVLLTVLVCVALELLLRTAEARRRRGVPRRAGTVAPRRGTTAFRVSIPPGVFLDTGHTWVEVEPSGATRIGVDDFVSKALGRIDRVELPRRAQEVRRGQRLFSLRQGERVATLTAPLDGVVTSVNRGLALSARPVQTGPYTSGWICTLEPRQLRRSLRLLLIAEESIAWLRKEVRRLQSFLTERARTAAGLGEVIQDGGDVTAGVLERVDRRTWDLFVSDFLRQ